ncbi:14646_t:CDS:2, partial [Funneliformis geosporum]
DIADGLSRIHKKSIIHRDFHSGNILIEDNDSKIGDLGLSKSATEADDNETYGIIPYMAPEVLQGQKYTKASDIYSFGMIMWECMTGRRPFWDRSHDTELIIDICDGLRPPTVDIVAPEGYIEIMKECWDPDQSKRPAGIVVPTVDLLSRDGTGEKHQPVLFAESTEPYCSNLQNLIMSLISVNLVVISYLNEFQRKRFIFYGYCTVWYYK